MLLTRATRSSTGWSTRRRTGAAALLRQDAEQEGAHRAAAGDGDDGAQLAEAEAASKGSEGAFEALRRKNAQLVANKDLLATKLCTGDADGCIPAAVGAMLDAYNAAIKTAISYAAFVAQSVEGLLLDQNKQNVGKRVEENLTEALDQAKKLTVLTAPLSALQGDLTRLSLDQEGTATMREACALLFCENPARPRAPDRACGASIRARPPARCSRAAIPMSVLSGAAAHRGRRRRQRDGNQRVPRRRLRHGAERLQQARLTARLFPWSREPPCTVRVGHADLLLGAGPRPELRDRAAPTPLVATTLAATRTRALRRPARLFTREDEGAGRSTSTSRTGWQGRRRAGACASSDEVCSARSASHGSSWSNSLDDDYAALLDLAYDA